MRYREQEEQAPPIGERIRNGKLNAPGSLYLEIAHELNNPLNNAKLFVANAEDLVIREEADKEQILRELRNAMTQVNRAAEIVSHLLTFGRMAPARRETVPLHQVLERALSLLDEQLRLRQIEVIAEMGPEEPVVIGNALELEQVFVNLLINARDAVAASPRKAIRISGSVHGNQIEIDFADTGLGIPPQLQSKVFDPFFTTKQEGRGTGLGLSIVHRIVHDHGGSIAVSSYPGAGTTFTIRLPLAAVKKEGYSPP